MLADLWVAKLVAMTVVKLVETLVAVKAMM